MKVTASSFIRWSGLAALVAGLIFAGIQPIHPPDVLSSVTTGAWAIITTSKTVMCLLFLVGITGIYARQVKEAGWLGLAGFLLLILCWWLQSAYVFAETFILPQLATAAPQFVESLLGIASGNPGEMNIGAPPAIYSLGIGIPYMLGGLLFGIATLRAGILPRWPAGLLAVAATLTPAAALLPHDIQRLAAIPVGLALAWLGYALWSERRVQASDPAPDFTASRLVLEPGWRWSENVKPIAGTDSCQVLHTGYHVSGRLHVRLDDGTEKEYGPGDAYVIPPGHDAWVVGDEPVVTVDMSRVTAEQYAKEG